jgi:transcriptional regulator with XRE-family HTH domain
MDINILDFVKEKAKELHVSNNQLAQRAGISRYHVQNIVHGRNSNPTIKTAQGLLKAVGYTLKIEKLDDEI